MNERKFMYNPDLFNEHLCTWRQSLVIQAMVLEKNEKVIDWCQRKQTLINQLNDESPIPERTRETDNETRTRADIRKELNALGSMQDIISDNLPVLDTMSTDSDWVIKDRQPLAIKNNVYGIITTLMYFGSRNRMLKGMKRDDALWMTDDMLKDRGITGINLASLKGHNKSKNALGRLYNLHVQGNKFIVDPVVGILDVQNTEGPGYIKWQESDGMKQWNDTLKLAMVLDYTEAMKTDPILDGVDK